MGRKDFDAGNTFRGPLEGVGPEMVKRVPFGPKKVEICRTADEAVL